MTPQKRRICFTITSGEYSQIWEAYMTQFGKEISPDRGERPTHQELVDWMRDLVFLAAEGILFGNEATGEEE